MNLSFQVSGRIDRPVEAVFEAVVDPNQLSSYFTTGGAEGRLDTGATVLWNFADFPGAFPVTVVEVTHPSRIVLRWDAAPEAGSYQTEVIMSFEATEDGRTLVTIAESGWRDDAAGLKASYDNCAGWMQMLCALKVWAERGINIREGMFR
jgi:uncharacterized protein YndB with AHSA1/START domain